MSSAEFFAKAGVKILNSLGVVDYISFGSESGDIYSLEKTADLIMSEAFEEKVSELMKSNESKKLGYPQICDIALKQLSEGVQTPAFSTPNNILALEYIKELHLDSQRYTCCQALSRPYHTLRTLNRYAPIGGMLLPD